MCPFFAWFPCQNTCWWIFMKFVEGHLDAVNWLVFTTTSIVFLVQLACFSRVTAGWPGAWKKTIGNNCSLSLHNCVAKQCPSRNSEHWHRPADITQMTLSFLDRLIHLLTVDGREATCFNDSTGTDVRHNMNVPKHPRDTKIWQISICELVMFKF